MARESAPFNFQPVRALRALLVLVGNPDDTAQVFTIIESLAAFAPQQMLERFRTDPNGRALLRARPNILTLLGDRARLEAMPSGSLAHAYLAFLDRENITPAGLVEASLEGENGTWRSGDDHGFVSNRMRDTHDLWHAATGYQGDVLGEAALLSFSLPQTLNPGVALIVLGGVLRARDREFTRMVVEGFRKGQQAAWLPAVDWEGLLPLPLDEVRRRLGITPVAPYVPMRSSWLRESGQLAAA